MSGRVEEWKSDTHTRHVEYLRRNVSFQIVVEKEFPITRTHQQPNDEWMDGWILYYYQYEFSHTCFYLSNKLHEHGNCRDE